VNPDLQDLGGTRRAVLVEVAAQLSQAAADAPSDVLRVGVDGRDGAGKTVLADELADVLRASGLEVVRATIDRFHHPRAVRYRRGRSSPEGFYLDSYDLTAVRRCLLDPLEPGGDRRVVLGLWDVDRDIPIEPEERTLADGSILLVDGIFLHRPELRDAWHVTLYLDVEVATGLDRCAARDGVVAEVAANRRYVEGQRLYHEACRPEEVATWLIDNDHLTAPRIVRGPTNP
jgi:uridine kinase